MKDANNVATCRLVGGPQTATKAGLRYRMASYTSDPCFGSFACIHILRHAPSMLFICLVIIIIVFTYILSNAES